MKNSVKFLKDFLANIDRDSTEVMPKSTKLKKNKTWNHAQLTNFNFPPKYPLIPKISTLPKNTRFFKKYPVFPQNIQFSSKNPIISKISAIPKNTHFFKKIHFSAKIST